ncbi:MAG: SMP-30/gluconolactonase/LRE family protein [Usitatibacter sp.]
MKKLWIACLAAGAIVFGAGATSADDRSGPISLETQDFAVLPDGVRYPEGITANPATGDIYASTFDFGPNANKLVRFSRTGRVIAVRDFGATPLLGLDFAAGKVYILNFGASKLQRIAAGFNASTPVEDVATIPSIGTSGSRTVGNPDGTSDTLTFGSNGFAGPNAMVFDRAGNLYISDSFQGAVFRVDHAASCATPCPVLTISHDPLLATAGFPPFGANGLALSDDEKTLFIAITGDNRVLKMDLGATPPAIGVFAESLHGADGLLFDNGLLWVATNQADQVVALNDKGRIVAKAGEFQGIRRDGTPRGLLFPASMVIVDGWMYVSNLALPLTSAVGDEPEEDVTRWTVSRFRVPR